MKNKLRKIVLNNDEYLWKVTTRYREANQGTKNYCALVEVKAYKLGMKNTPLTVKFNVLDDPVLGTKITSNASEVNLHQPSYARIIIKAGLELGWEPDVKSFIIKDGIKILEQCGISSVCNI